MALPPFHVFGIVTELYCPIAFLTTTVVYPPRTYNDPLAQPVIPTSENVIEQLKQIESNVLMTVPTLLEQIATSDEAIGVLKKMDSVVSAIYTFYILSGSVSPDLWWWSPTCQGRTKVGDCWGTARQWIWRDRIRNPRGIGAQARYRRG